MSTADISGQIILNVTITSAGIVDLDQVDIPLTEYIPQVYDYFTFEVNDDGKTVTLTDYDSSLSDSTDVVIPSTVSQNSSGEWIEGNTYTVTAIDNNATSSSNSIFRNSGITSINLPSTLLSIGNYAFYECSGLTSVDLNGCTNLTSIGYYAFNGCDGLTSVDLSGCTSLTSIGSFAFSDCSGLTGTVTIPASVTSIGSNPFSGCSNLEGIVVEGGNSEYYIKGNCLIENSTKTLITGFNNSTIPSDIKIIGNSAFRDCSGLTSISLPSSLTSIGIQAFYRCSGLTGELNLGECTSLTSIGDWAFEGCRGLTSISLPSSLTSIGNFAFRYCSNLTEVIIDSEYVYTKATSASACGSLLSYATSVKVLTSLVSDSHAYINATNFPNISTEVIGEKNYTVYSK